MLRHPRHRVRGQRDAECSTSKGVGRELDAGRRVNDDRRHTSPAARASASVSAARTPRSSGSSPRRRSSHVTNNSGVTSSSGLSTTTAGSDGTSGRRATIPSLRPAQAADRPRPGAFGRGVDNAVAVFRRARCSQQSARRRALRCCHSVFGMPRGERAAGRHSPTTPSGYPAFAGVPVVTSCRGVRGGSWWWTSCGWS